MIAEELVPFLDELAGLIADQLTRERKTQRIREERGPLQQRVEHGNVDTLTVCCFDRRVGP